MCKFLEKCPLYMAGNNHRPERCGNKSDEAYAKMTECNHDGEVEERPASAKYTVDIARIPEIKKLIKEGLTAKEIGQKVNLTSNRIYHYARVIEEKYGLKITIKPRAKRANHFDKKGISEQTVLSDARHLTKVALAKKYGTTCNYINNYLYARGVKPVLERKRVRNQFVI